MRQKGITIGFVPTMGALHGGHTALMERAVAECGAVVVSIFVNPTQFNDPQDLISYPRTLPQDLAKCRTAGVDLVFAPSAQEVYRTPEPNCFDFGPLGQVMEGTHRPGHFHGVAEVVSRLFAIVEPQRAYFGMKDYQQLAIIRWLVAQKGFTTEVVASATVREPDGLAMSSRNARLSPQQRASAPLIWATLQQAKGLRDTMSAADITRWVEGTINADPNLQVEYFQLANAQTLQPIARWADAQQVVGCIAVRAGSVRLIDNIMF